jgi:hypothetical protein
MLVKSPVAVSTSLPWGRFAAMSPANTGTWLPAAPWRQAEAGGVQAGHVGVELGSRSRQREWACVLRDGIDLHVSPLPGAAGLRDVPRPRAMWRYGRGRRRKEPEDQPGDASLRSASPA